MGKRDKLSVIFCRRCNAAHPEGEHLAKPKKLITPAMWKVINAELPAVLAQRVSPPDDGVALKSIAHHKGPGVGRGRGRLHKAALETIEAPPSVVAEVERLGPVEIAKRKADRKKRHKEELGGIEHTSTTGQDLAKALALPASTAKKWQGRMTKVEAELERKRALRAARQARWRAGLQKKAKKRKKK